MEYSRNSIHKDFHIPSVLCGRRLALTTGTLQMTESGKDCFVPASPQPIAIPDRFQKSNLDFARVLIDESTVGLQIALRSLFLKYGKYNIRVDKELMSWEAFMKSVMRVDFCTLLNNIKHISGKENVVARIIDNEVFQREEVQDDLEQFLQKVDPKAQWSQNLDLVKRVAEALKGTYKSLRVSQICDLLLSFLRNSNSHQQYLLPEKAQDLRSERFIHIYICLVISLLSGLYKIVEEMSVEYLEPYEQTIFNIRELKDDFWKFTCWSYRARSHARHPPPPNWPEDIKRRAIEAVEQLRQAIEQDNISAIEYAAYNLRHRLVYSEGPSDFKFVFDKNKGLQPKPGEPPKPPGYQPARVQGYR